MPKPALRTIEMVGDRVSVLIYDKAQLDEEDIFPAALLVYGKGDACFAKRIGTRWFLSPGKLCASGGICVIEEHDDEVAAHFFSERGTPLLSERLPTVVGTKLTVQGGA